MVCGSEISTISAPASRNHLAPCCQNASISAGMPSRRYSLGMPIRIPFTLAPDRRLVIRHFDVGRGGVLRIDRGHGAEQDGGIADGAGDGSRLVERGGEGDNAPARAAAIGGLQSDRPGEGGGLPDGAARIGGGGPGAKHRRDGGGGAAGGAARHQIGVAAALPPGIDHRAVEARLVGGAHGELVHVELAEHDRAVVPEILGHGQFVGWLEAVEDVARRLCVHALGGEQILDAERHAFERPPLPARQAFVGSARHVARLLRRHHDEGVQERIGGLDRRKIGIRQFQRGKIPFRQSLADLGDGERGEVGHSERFFS